MRRPVSGRLLSQELLLLGAVSGDGLRSTDLPREPSRHRSMSLFRARQTVSQGVPRPSGSLDVGGRERVARGAHLRGLRPGVDRYRTALVCARSDHTVILAEIAAAQVYPDPLRRVTYFDAKTNNRLKFLTNNFVLPALMIAQIYKCRWPVELFFKWIQQHLRIQAFYGTSENAVKTPIWIAVSRYMLVAIVRKHLGLEASLYQILQILSVTLFEKVPPLRALEASDSQVNLVADPNQLILFDF